MVVMWSNKPPQPSLEYHMSLVTANVLSHWKGSPISRKLLWVTLHPVRPEKNLVSFCVTTVVVLSFWTEVHIRVATRTQKLSFCRHAPPRWLSTGWHIYVSVGLALTLLQCVYKPTIASADGTKLAPPHPSPGSLQAVLWGWPYRKLSWPWDVFSMEAIEAVMPIQLPFECVMEKKTVYQIRLCDHVCCIVDCSDRPLTHVHYATNRTAFFAGAQALLTSTCCDN